jgi:hypothetical protein
MLEYTSFCLIINVLYAYYNNDKIMHHLWLLILCTSLIHHSSNYTHYYIGKCDVILVHIISLIHIYMNIINQKIFPYLVFINFSLLFLITIIFYLNPNRTKLQHSFIHLSGIIVGCSTIYMKKMN